MRQSLYQQVMWLVFALSALIGVSTVNAAEHCSDEYYIDQTLSSMTLA